jgi:hypothetical protein
MSQNQSAYRLQKLIRSLLQLCNYGHSQLLKIVVQKIYVGKRICRSDQIYGMWKVCICSQFIEQKYYFYIGLAPGYGKEKNP